MLSRVKKTAPLLLLLLLLFPAAALAQVSGPGTSVIPNPLTNCSTLGCVVQGFLGFFFVLGGPLAVLMLVIGGFYLSTAAGDVERIKTGRSIIVYSVVGLAVIMIGLGIQQLVTSIVQPGTCTTPACVLGNIMQFVFVLGIPIVVLMLIYGAFQIVSGGGGPDILGKDGNPERIASGKKTIVWAIIGLIIVFLGLGIDKLLVAVIQP